MAGNKTNRNAKDYAKEQLGNLDLSYLDSERAAVNNIYNNSKTALENNFNSLIEQINNNRDSIRKNFNSGRATVAEQAYNTNRTNQADLVSRGVGSSGLKSLAEVGNRMETGRQYSNLANDFYSDMSEMDTTEKQGRNQYATDQQSLKNTLDQSLAGIDSRAAEAKNNYNMILGQLAEAVQGRWDNNANAKAALDQAKAAAAQAHQDAVNASRQNLKYYNQNALNNIVSNKDLDADAKISQISQVFGVDTATAKNVLHQLGVNLGSNNYKIYTDEKGYVSILPEGYDSSINYLDQLLGGVK